MDPGDAINIVIIIVLVILSAFFSSAETALTAVSKLRIRALEENGVKSAKKVLKLIENPSKMLSAILICNNIVNLTASSLSTSLAMDISKKMGLSEESGWMIGIATGVLTFVILIFGEITPKISATVNAEKMSLRYGNIILIITTVLTPIIFVLNKIVHLFLLILRVDTKKEGLGITEDELRTFVNASQEEGVIEREEQEMITNIVEFGDSKAKDVMIPRMDISMVDLSISYEDLRAQFLENKYARLPVYDDSIDNIVGVINLKDFAFYTGSKEDFNLKDLIRDVSITYEYKNVSELFMEMRKDSIPLTMVLDEYGALAGLITMEDLLEEIVGEIRDEYDNDEEDEIQQVSDEEFIVLGTTPIDDINERLEFNIETDEYDSMAGHIIKLCEHFPDPGEQTQDVFAIYTVLECSNNRVDKIHIIKKAPVEESDPSVE